MKKDADTIAQYYEKLTTAGVHNALLEQTKQTNLELTEALLRTPEPDRIMSMNSVYQHYASNVQADTGSGEGSDR